MSSSRVRTSHPKLPLQTRRRTTSKFARSGTNGDGSSPTRQKISRLGVNLSYLRIEVSRLILRQPTSSTRCSSRNLGSRRMCSLVSTPVHGRFPQEPGTYRIYCTERCVVGYSRMIATVTVVNQTVYDEWTEANENEHNVTGASAVGS